MLSVISSAISAINNLTDTPLTLGKALPAILSHPLVGGWSYMGTLNHMLDKLAKAYNFAWCIDKNTLQFHDKHGTSPAAIGDAIVLSKDTGLIRIPTPHEYSYATLDPDSGKHEKAVRYIGARFECLLNPHIGPGSVIQLQSIESQFDHWYLVRDITYHGEWMGANWECTILADQANAVG